jgi:hypothetical protein
MWLVERIFANRACYRGAIDDRMAGRHHDVVRLMSRWVDRVAEMFIAESKTGRTLVVQRRRLEKARDGTPLSYMRCFVQLPGFFFGRTARFTTFTRC